MLHAGLTGSIAVGKSFVLKTFAALGCYTADADTIAREVVMPGTEGWQLIRREFGDDVINAAGEVDRAALGAKVFSDKDKRERLNAVLHPLIIKRQLALMQAWRHSEPDGVSVIEAALIIEAGGANRFDKLIVAHCREDVQRERLMTRNNLSLEEARKRIAAQMPQREKLKFADFAIDTSDGFESARRQTVAVYQQLKTLATANR